MLPLPLIPRGDNKQLTMRRGRITADRGARQVHEYVTMNDWDDAKRQVQQATDIVRMIGEHVALRPRGKEFVGVCPFHDDKNPSMYVSPTKQIFKCFACGAGGDVFSFTMDYHKMSFPEAMKHLAGRAGIKLPERASGAGGASGSTSGGDREMIADANVKAMQFYRALLAHEQHGRIARDYLASRSISDQMVEAFGIGYAPDRWDGLATMIESKHWNRRAFEMAGLITTRPTGDGQYDRLRHRLIFPIFDATGRPIAFGGRVLEGGTIEARSEAKYLNSPETPLFNKSATLYGLHLAKQPIIRSHTAVIVEGYTDVIACHQAGANNAVATLGTALTRQHAQALRHFCDRVVLVFDADEAGQKAADRAMEVFFGEPIDVSIAVLPDGLDPADLLGREGGVEQWKAATEHAADAMAFHFARVRSAADAVDTLTGKQRVYEDYIRRLAQLGAGQLAPERRGMVIHQIAGLMHLDANTVDDMLRRAAPRRAYTATRERAAEPSDASGGATTPTDRVRAERLIVGCLLAMPSLFHEPMPDGRTFDEAVLPGDIEHDQVRQLYEVVHEHLAHADELSIADLRQKVEDDALVRLAADLQLEAERLTDESPVGLAATLSAAYKALAASRQQQEYQWNKMRLREQAGDEDDRLRLAQRNARANPSATRFPRVAR